LEQDLSTERVFRRLTTEVLQGALTVCTDKTVTSWLAAEEQKSPVQSIQVGDEDAVKTVKAVGESLAVVYKSTPWRSLAKQPISIHSCMVRVM
jgi:hypothetical protein